MDTPQLRGCFHPRWEQHSWQRSDQRYTPPGSAAPFPLARHPICWAARCLHDVSFASGDPAADGHGPGRRWRESLQKTWREKQPAVCTCLFWAPFYRPVLCSGFPLANCLAISSLAGLASHFKQQLILCWLKLPPSLSCSNWPVTASACSDLLLTLALSLVSWWI